MWQSMNPKKGDQGGDMWQSMNRRNVGTLVRVVAVVAIMLQMLLVPAAQAQGLQGSPELQCHPGVTADCATGKVQLVTSGTYHILTIWLDPGTAGQRILVGPKIVNGGTWTFNWAELGVNVCVSHKLKAKWSGSGEKSFGGSSCCSCKETTDWQLISTGPWYYCPDTGKVCRDKVYVKYDKYNPTKECDRKTEKDCSYKPCTEVTDWVIVDYGAWHVRLALLVRHPVADVVLDVQVVLDLEHVAAPLAILVVPRTIVHDHPVRLLAARLV